MIPPFSQDVGRLPWTFGCVPESKFEHFGITKVSGAVDLGTYFFEQP